MKTHPIPRDAAEVAVVPLHTMLLLGAAGVGKTQLFSKFVPPGDWGRGLGGGLAVAAVSCAGSEQCIHVSLDEAETRISFIESRALDNSQVP